MTAPSVSVLMAQWGKTELTLRATDAVRRSDHEGAIEILVYDNASPGGPGPIIDRQDVTVVRGDRNIGFGPAINALASRAAGDLLLILNNDTVVEPRAIRLLAERLTSDETHGVVAPQYRRFDGDVQEMGGYLGRDGKAWQLFKRQRPPAAFARLPFESHYASAAAMLVRREDFLEVGGFDDIYAPAYYEDTDLCLRLRQRGQRTVVEPRAIVFHYEGGTAGRDVSEGLKAYQVKNQATFHERWRTQLAALPPIDRRAAFAHALAPREAGGLRILWMCPYLPRPDHEAGHKRIVKMIQTLVDAGDRVVLWAENCHDADRYGRQLEAMGVPWLGRNLAARWELPLGTPDTFAEIEEVLTAVEWDAVIISFPEFARRASPRIRRHRPNAAILVDDVDLHFLRTERAAAMGAVSGTERLTKRAELAIYRASDGVITASDDESRILRSQNRGLAVRSFGVAAEHPHPPVDLPEATQLLFLGNFNHPPNVDAVQYWVDELAWEVERQAGRPLPLRVIGSGSDAYADVWLDRAGPRLDIGGWVPDLDVEFRRCRVFLAPLRYGAGTKGKIAAAIAHGIPVITTTIGAEGMPPEVVEGSSIADEPATLAKEVVRLMTDDESWQAQRDLTAIAAAASWDHQRAVEDALVAFVHERARRRR